MKSIFVVGYFGYETDQLDGQTVKTRNIFSLLKKHWSGGITYYDTQHFRKNRLSVLSLLYQACRCNLLVLLPAQNNLTIVYPILYMLSKIFHFEIVQIAIGGWLDKYCAAHPVIANLLRKNKCILVENKDVINSLQSIYGFGNVRYLHNYRITDFKPDFVRGKSATPLRIVFMARVNRMKGLDVIFAIAEHYKRNIKRGIEIDFYGPVEPSHKEYFETNVSKYECIKYCGILKPEDIYKTLNGYDAMILPTRYHTEGFPGSILDAYISGIPVVVSNWKHAHEFVVDGYNGYVCDVENPGEFIRTIDIMIDDRDMLLEMKRNAFESSHQYSAEVAWKILNNYLRI